jgi:sugar phosphate isomerase/epimerase
MIDFFLSHADNHLLPKQGEKNMFKVSILFGDGPQMDPAKIAPGFEISEIPAGPQVNPLMTEDEWQAKKVELKSWNLPPIKVASHWLDQNCTVPGADWEFMEFWTKRVMRRLSEIGVEIAGVYGMFFPKVSGYSTVRQMDQAIRYVNMIGDCAKPYRIMVALEPMADLKTLWPTYLEGLKFAKQVAHPNVKVMADLNYFLKLDQPFDVIREDPAFCLHGHIAGDGGQPGVGNLVEKHKSFFRVLRSIGYEGAVSAACPWVSTQGGILDLRRETARTLEYMKRLREEVYSE